MKKFIAITIPSVLLVAGSIVGYYLMKKWKREEKEALKREKLKILQERFTDKKYQEDIILKVKDDSLLISMQQLEELTDIMKLLMEEGIVEAKASQNTFKAKSNTLLDPH
jgi:lactam utilization protein B